MMNNFAILRLLVAFFFLTVAWPLIPLAITNVEKLFWGIWLVFLVIVIGANLSTLLQMTPPPIMEQERTLDRKTHNH